MAFILPGSGVHGGIAGMTVFAERKSGVALSVRSQGTSSIPALVPG